MEEDTSIPDIRCIPHSPGLTLIPRGKCRWIVERSLSTSTAWPLARLFEVGLGFVCQASLGISPRS